MKRRPMRNGPAHGCRRKGEWEVAARKNAIAVAVEIDPAFHPVRLAAGRLAGGLGVDLESLHGLSGLSARSRRSGRVQRKVHGQSDGVARPLFRNAARTRTSDIPQLLPARCTMAVFRPKVGQEWVCSAAAPAAALLPAHGRRARPRWRSARASASFKTASNSPA
jgi:hypothetical protein